MGLNPKGAAWPQQTRGPDTDDFREFRAGTWHSAESAPDCLPNKLLGLRCLRTARVRWRGGNSLGRRSGRNSVCAGFKRKRNLTV